MRLGARRSASTTARRSPGSGASRTPASRLQARTRCPSAHRSSTAARTCARSASSRSRQGDRIPFALTLVPVARAAAPRDRCRACAGRNADATGRTGRAAAATAANGRRGCRARSIVLKALTYAPTGGIVAAPTTSLPEKIGGVRNWDYRYCWLRDATLTLLAFLNAGYLEEARAWRDWLLRAAAGRSVWLQIMYGVAGERRLTELELPWLPGYEGSQPGTRRQRRRTTVSARRLRRGPRRAAPGAASTSSRCPREAWALQRRLLELPRARAGRSPTRASGRCAGRGGTSLTRR